LRLAECLNGSDIATLRKIAERYKFECPKYSKLTLIQEITYAFRTPTFLNEHFSTLFAQRPTSLLRLCLDSRDMFSAEDLAAMFGPADKSTRPFEGVLRDGWLFPTSRANGRILFVIPEEIKRAMRTYVMTELQSQMVTAEQGPVTYREEDTALSRDLGMFLEYVRHHDVQLTVEGAMYKRYLQQVLSLLEIDEEVLSGGWRFGYGRRFHDYPDRFALLYDYAFAEHLICEGVDSILHVTPEATAWLSSERITRQRSIVRYYISLYRRPIPRLPQVVQLFGFVTEKWVKATSAFTVLAALLNAYYYDDVTHVWQDRILKMLMHLGLIRIGEDENSTTWFQITKLGQQLLTQDTIVEHVAREPERILIVQPNFEILVTEDAPLITAELALFAEVKEAGAVRVYRLTDNSVLRGLETGRPLDKWMEFVQQNSQSPMPGNVERTLQEWAKLYMLEGGSKTS